MPVPILTYHGINIHGNDYSNNDHVALRQDLALIFQMGFRIVSLQTVVDQLLEQATGDQELTRCVAIAFDDGAHFDFYDLDHPTCGRQRSLLNIMRDVGRQYQQAPGALHATSFVIASPEARMQLDKTCLIGSNWWSDAWWFQAQASGQLAIENHSWDHNHETLERVAQRQQHKGNFMAIDCYADADAQIRQASDYINQLVSGHKTSLFAYPYGDVNVYLSEEYLPHYQHQHGIRAAFTTRPEPVTEASERWRLPRFVCGDAWRTGAELKAILHDVQPRTSILF